MIGALLGLKAAMMKANPFANAMNSISGGLPGMGGAMRGPAAGLMGGMPGMDGGNPLKDLLMQAIQPEAPAPAAATSPAAPQDGPHAAKNLINGLPQSIGPAGGPQSKPQAGGMTRKPPMENLTPAPGEPHSLIQNESGGRWDAQNNAMGAGGQKGHFGRLQFGHARLAEAKAAGVLPRDMTPAQFMKSPQAQKATEAWHWSDIDKYVADKGLGKFVGQTIGGVKITPDAMRSMAHLGGKGGMERFLTTGGRYNPADVNGTRLSDYGQRHGAAQGSASAAKPMLPEVFAPAGSSGEGARSVNRLRGAANRKMQTGGAGPEPFRAPAGWADIIKGEPGTFGEEKERKLQGGEAPPMEAAEAPQSQQSDDSRRQAMLQAVREAMTSPLPDAQSKLRQMAPSARFTAIADYGAALRGEVPSA